MATLNEQVMELIKENRRLKREVAKLADETSPAVNGSGEKTLRSLQRKVQRAVAGAQPVASRRRTTTSGTARRRRPSEATQASAAD